MSENTSSTSSTLSPVQFHEDTIYCTTINGQPFTPMKPIVDNLGLNWGSQSAKLKANEGRWGIAMIAIPSAGGDQEMVCMPVRKLPAYLNTINPRKVSAALREKIIQYQEESDDVLWNYWMNQQKETGRPVLSSVADRKPLRNVVNVWADATGQSYPACWKQVNAAFNLAKISELPAAWVPDACAWVQARIDAVQQPPVIEHKQQVELLPDKIEIPEGHSCGKGTVSEAKVVWENLVKAQRALDVAFQSQEFVGGGDARSMVLSPEKEAIWQYMNKLHIAAMSNINAAGAFVRGLLALKHVVDFC